MSRHKITRHFAVEEFDCHDGTRVPDDALNELHALCAHWLEPLRETFGPVIVHSGFRTEAYNRTVGGARSSYHIYTITRRWGVAADVECQSGSVALWGDFIEHLANLRHKGHGGLGRYPQGGFVHVDNRPYRARWVGP